MTAEPDMAGPLVAVDLPGIASTPYRVYPVVDHVADKVCAMHEVHSRAGTLPQGSTRFRDLLDLTTFARTTKLDASAIVLAVRSEADRRGLVLPDRVTVPKDSDWRAGYAREVRLVPSLVDRDLDAAITSLAASWTRSCREGLGATGIQPLSRGRRE